MNSSPPGSSDLWDSPGKNTRECSHSLLQAIFQTQGLNLGLLHCRQILYCLRHQGRNPKVCVIYRRSINILINMLHIYGTQVLRSWVTFPRSQNRAKNWLQIQWQWTSLVAQMLKNPPAMRETWAWSLGWKRSPGAGNDYPLQHSGLENSMDRRDWWATVHRVTKSQTQLSHFHQWQSLLQGEFLLLHKTSDCDWVHVLPQTPLQKHKTLNTMASWRLLLPYPSFTALNRLIYQEQQFLSKLTSN